MSPIAIIGIGCRFPKAEGPREFWRLLCDGVDAIGEVPADRWNIDELHDPAPQSPGKMNSRFGGFLRGVDQFDPQFFGVSPREAIRMDPQQRLALEVAWETLEDAGIPPPRLAGSAVGVFLGFGVPEYFIDQVRDVRRVNEYTNSGNTLSMIANRISYVFDFRGPSLVLDTACSSSLISVLLACQSLERGDSSLALAGGVNLILSPATTIGFSQLRALSPDGRCRSFDARANGYVRGEGVGILALKRLSDAVADGDEIYALIRGGAMNQDGRSNGITAPNRFAQEAVLRAAYANAGLAPGEVQYVEAHGSGTLLGDPIEANALGAVLAEGRNGHRCAIGSVKTNIGHSEAAAGVAGLIKTALALKHGMLPPSLHFQSPNPHIDFERLPLRVQSELQPWPETGGVKLAGVSSFGYGGANAHVVLEAPRTRRSSKRGLGTSIPLGAGQASPLEVLTVSGRSAEALAANARAIREFLANELTNVPFGDACYTAAACRAHHEHRLCIVTTSKEDAVAALDEFLDGAARESNFAGRKPAAGAPKVAFRYQGPGRGESLPELFETEYKLTKLLESWGITAAAVAGHWLGDGVAACLSGEMTFAEAKERVASFAAGAAELAEDGDGSQAPDEAATHECPLLVEIRPSCREDLVRSVANLYAQGVEIDWREFYRERNRLRVKLPSYRLQRKRYWLEESEETGSAAGEPCQVEWMQLPCAISTWQASLSAAEPAWLADHRVMGAVLFPATAVFTLAHACASLCEPGARLVLESVTLEQMLPVSESPRLAQIAIHAASDSRAFQLFSQADKSASWIRHAWGCILRGNDTESLPKHDLDSLRGQLRAGPTAGEFYDDLAARGLDYGPAFRGVRQLWRRDGEALGSIEPPAELQAVNWSPRVHPALLDAALHVIAAALPEQLRQAAAYVPARLERLEFHAEAWRGGWSHAQIREAGDGPLVADVRLYDADGCLAIELTGLGFERLALAEKAESSPAMNPESGPEPELNRDLLLSYSPEKRQRGLLTYLRSRLAAALEMDVAELDVDEPLHHLGLDSLVIFKLAAKIERELHVEIPLMELAVGPSVSEFTQLLLQQIEEH